MEYVLIIALTPVLFGLAVILRNRILFVMLCTIPGYVGYLLGLRNSVLSAFTALLIWALLQSALVIFSSVRSTTKMAKLIFRSETYTENMFRWIETGILPEGNSIQVIRTHIQQTLMYCVLAFVTGNFVSLIFGCMLLNYMNFYVSQLAARSKSWKAFVFGWNPWSILRVLAFLWLGAVLGLPLISYIQKMNVEFQLMWLVPGIIGVIVDLILKLTISDKYRMRLGRL
ncbi:hypothetical protein L0244_16990 [bacterium]|nr:hypothetical protein [bacterium]